MLNHELSLRIDALSLKIIEGQRIASDSNPSYWTLNCIDQEKELQAAYDKWVVDTIDLLRIAFESYATEFGSLHFDPPLFGEPHEGIHNAIGKQLDVLHRAERELSLSSATYSYRLTSS